MTDLGLKYNLLTAYTSFIAVDTEVRNKGGESTTVKQPLPLPQGVSDYAVGSGGVPMASMAPMAPMGRGMAYDMALPTKMAREEARQKSDARKAAFPNVVQATAAGGLSKGDVLAVAQGHLKEIEQCAQGITGKLVIELTVAPDGTVKEVKIVSGVVKGSAAEQCLAQAVKKWIFPAAKAAPQTKATITFDLS